MITNGFSVPLMCVVCSWSPSASQAAGREGKQQATNHLTSQHPCRGGGGEDDEFIWSGPSCWGGAAWGVTWGWRWCWTGIRMGQHGEWPGRRRGCRWAARGGTGRWCLPTLSLLSRCGGLGQWRPVLLSTPLSIWRLDFSFPSSGHIPAHSRHHFHRLHGSHPHSTACAGFPLSLPSLSTAGSARGTQRTRSACRTRAWTAVWGCRSCQPHSSVLLRKTLLTPFPHGLGPPVPTPAAQIPLLP